jgi:chromosome segregation ATPase
LAAPAYKPWRSDDQSSEPITATTAVPGTWKQLLDDSRSRIDQLAQLRKQTGRNLRAGTMFLQNLNQRRQDITHLTERVTSVEQKAREQLDAVRDQATENRQTIAEVHQRADEHGARLADHAEKLDHLTEQQAKAADKIDKQHADLSHRLVDLSARTQELIDRADVTSQLHAAAAERIDANEASIKDLAESQHVTASRVEWLRQAQTNADEQIDTLQQSLHETTKQLTAWQENTDLRGEFIQRQVQSLATQADAMTDRARQIEQAAAERAKRVDQMLDAAAKGRQTLRDDMTAAHEALRQDMAATHEALRQDMSAAHETLRQDMTATHEALRHEIDQTLRQEIREAHESFREDLAAVRKQVGKVALYAAKVGKATDGLATRADEQAAQIAEHADQQQLLHDQSATRLDSVEQFTSQLDRSLNELASAAEQRDVTIESQATEQRYRHEQVVGRIGAVEKNTQSLHSRTDAMCDRVDRLTGSLETMAGELESARHAAGLLRQRLEEFAQEAIEYNNQTTDEQLALGARIDNLQHGLARVASHVDNLAIPDVTPLTERVEALENREPEQAADLSGLVQRIEHAEAAARRPMAEMPGLIQRVEQAEAAARRPLPDVAGVIRRVEALEQRPMPEPASAEAPDVDLLKAQLDRINRIMETMAVRTGEYRMRLEAMERASREAPAVAAAAVSGRLGQIEAALSEMEQRLNRPITDEAADPAPAAPKLAQPVEDDSDQAATNEEEHRGYHGERIDDNKAVPFGQLMDRLRQDAA